MRPTALALLLPCVLSTPTSAGEPESDVVARPATVLLITHGDLAAAWQPFAHWKTRTGKRTEILTLDAIAAKYTGADLQAKIKACITAHRTGRGTRWVVLGGDGDGPTAVPDRDTAHRMSRRMQYRDVPADVWYVADKDWNTDGDGLVGFWPKDKDALSYGNPEGTCIGRIPVRTAAQVKAYTDKVVAYESRYPTGKFATEFLYTCAVPMANYKADMVWDRYLSPAWKPGRISRFFTNKTPWDGEEAGDHDLSPANFVAKLNEGRFGKMHIHGHGHQPGWVFEGDQVVSRTTVAKLANAGAYPAITTVSCHTGRFDSGTDPSITESMLRAPGAGAILCVAPAREGVPVFDSSRWDPRDGKTQDGTTRLLTLFWMNALSKDLTAGEALYAAKQHLAPRALAHHGFHWVLSEINLLGDPTLDLRARPAISPTADAPKAIGVGVRQVTVKTGTPGLTVCLWKGDEVYVVATTGDDGAATLTVAPRTAGAMLCTVSGPSANAVRTTIAVR